MVGVGGLVGAMGGWSQGAHDNSLPKPDNPGHPVTPLCNAVGSRPASPHEREITYDGIWEFPSIVPGIQRMHTFRVETKTQTSTPIYVFDL